MNSFYAKRILIRDWTTYTDDPEHNRLVNAMYAIEAREGDRRGWDQPPTVWTARLTDIDAGSVYVEQIPMRSWHRGAANPVDDLVLIGAEVGYPRQLPPYTSYADTADGIAAVMFMCEMWGRPPAR